MVETLRGRNLPPPKRMVPAVGTHVDALEDATKRAQTPIEQVGHAVLDKLVEALRQQPGHTHYKCEGVADLGLIKVRVTTIVDIKPLAPPDAG